MKGMTQRMEIGSGVLEVSSGNREDWERRIWKRKKRNERRIDFLMGGVRGIIFSK